MPPLLLLIALIALTIGMVIVETIRRGRTHCVLRQLAVERQLHFSSRDRLRLTARVAAHLPITGAAHVRVFDLIYGRDGGHHRYVFTTEYTAGVIRSKKRLRRVATFREPRERCAIADEECTIQLATADLPLMEQYRELLK